MSPLGFAACQSKKCTNQAAANSFVGAVGTTAPPCSAPTEQQPNNSVGAVGTTAPPCSAPTD